MRDPATVFHQLDAVARADDNIRAMLLTSSRANPKAAVDRFSDYDIELFVADQRPFLANDDWLASLGPILVRWPYHPAVEGDRVTRLVMFEDGVRIDFGIFAAAALARLSTLPDLPDHYDLGYRVLLDKDGLTRDLPPPGHTAFTVSPPSELEYLEVVNNFWWEAITTAKSLWRGELYFARYLLDYIIRFECLEVMLRWRIGLDHGWTVNPGKLGRGFRRYLEPATWAELEATYAPADPAANWAALDNTIALYRRLAQELADALGFHYPATLDQYAAAYVQFIAELPEDGHRA